MNKCEKWFAQHNWNKWKNETKNIYRSQDKAVVGYKIVQIRDCKDCGITQMISNNVDL